MTSASFITPPSIVIMEVRYHALAADGHARGLPADAERVFARRGRAQEDGCTASRSELQSGRLGQALIRPPETAPEEVGIVAAGFHRDGGPAVGARLFRGRVARAVYMVIEEPKARVRLREVLQENAAANVVNEAGVGAGLASRAAGAPELRRFPAGRECQPSVFEVTGVAIGMLEAMRDVTITLIAVGVLRRRSRESSGVRIGRTGVASRVGKSYGGNLARRAVVPLVRPQAHPTWLGARKFYDLPASEGINCTSALGIGDIAQAARATCIGLPRDKKLTNLNIDMIAACMSACCHDAKPCVA